jgi:hypothetical protein
MREQTMTKTTVMSTALNLAVGVTLALAAGGCKKKPADKGKGDSMASSMAAVDPAAAMTAMAATAATGPADAMGTTAARPGPRPTAADPAGGAVVHGGLSDPDVIKRAIEESGKPQLGAKGFDSAKGTPAELCTAFIGKLVSCKHMPAYARARQTTICTSAAGKNKAFRDRLGVLPRLSCGHLTRIVKLPIRRGKTVKAGQGVGIITDAMLRQLGADMIEMAVAKHGKDEVNSKVVQRICNRITAVLKAAGKGEHKQVCVAAKAPSFNATALGDHILFHTSAVVSLENLAIAQIAFASDLRKYLRYQILLAAHVLLNRPLKEWPVPGCKKGDLACRATKLTDAKVKARREGLFLAILGHEFGHNLNNHARRKILRMEVLRVNAAQYSTLTKGKKAAFIDKLGSTALSQVDEYESDETSIRVLQRVWKATSARYKETTGDALMGPQPMDIVYVALFMQALSDAMKKLTGRAAPPALLQSHPASHARADRGLRVIIANGYAGHRLAKGAYNLLILRQGG